MVVDSGVGRIMETSNQRVEIAVGADSMGGYLARPANDDGYPGVLLFMEVFGINRHIRAVVDRVAAEGYVVLAPNVFHRSDPGVELEYDADGLSRGVDMMGQVGAGELIADMKAAVEFLETREDISGKGIGVMGFCFGGHAAYLAACELPVKAAVSFYGGGVATAAPGNEGLPTVERSGSITGSILCLFGENDTYIPADNVATVREALANADVDHEVVVYDGVGHGFFCDERPDYDKDSADDAWARLTTLFADKLA